MVSIMKVLCTDASLRYWRWPLHTLFASCLALALIACGGDDSAQDTNTAATTSDTTGPVVLEMGPLIGSGAPSTGDAAIKEFTQSVQDRVAPHVIVLPAQVEPKSAQLAASDPNQPLQIGFGRDVAEAANPAATASLLTWAKSADGRRRAAISVRSPGAAGLRLGLLVEQLPPFGVELRVYAPGDEKTIEIAGAEVLRTIQSNLDTGATGEDAHIYWLPIISGAEAVLEIELAVNINPSMIKLSLPHVSQLAIDPTSAGSEVVQKGLVSGVPSPLSCNVDAMCAEAKYDSLRRATAVMIATVSNGFYGYTTHMCSGVLLTNWQQDATPYFLTANHCIPNPVSASAVETYWNYTSTKCNSNLAVNSPP